MFRRAQSRPMPGQFEPLATYNAERSRGITHTAAWDLTIAALQREFDEWIKSGPGVVLVAPRDPYESARRW